MVIVGLLIYLAEEVTKTLKFIFIVHHHAWLFKFNIFFLKCENSKNINSLPWFQCLKILKSPKYHYIMMLFWKRLIVVEKYHMTASHCCTIINSPPIGPYKCYVMSEAAVYPDRSIVVPKYVLGDNIWCSLFLT